MSNKRGRPKKVIQIGDIEGELIPEEEFETETEEEEEPEPTTDILDDLRSITGKDQLATRREELYSLYNWMKKEGIHSISDVEVKIANVNKDLIK